MPNRQARYHNTDSTASAISGAAHAVCIKQLYQHAYYAPSTVEDLFDAYAAANETESALYARAEHLVKAFEGVLPTKLRGWYLRLNPLKASILLGVLADLGFVITDSTFLNQLAKQLSGEDSRLAQVTTIALITCGGAEGIYRLTHTLLRGPIPHLKAIKGVIELLGVYDQVLDLMQADLAGLVSLVEPHRSQYVQDRIQIRTSSINYFKDL